MKWILKRKPAFVVIGREGSTAQGGGFIGRLWGEANARFAEIAPLVERREDGSPAGIWGVMSAMDHSFRPWENDFSRGLYLAGAECRPEAVAPDGWTRWEVPGSEYLVVSTTEETLLADFQETLREMQRQNLTLAGAAYDFLSPTEDGKPQIWFPISRI